MDIGIATVSSIVVICFVIGAGIKASKKVTNNNIIPYVVAIVGGSLGAVGYFCKVPDFPANDALTAIAVGMASGLAATGIKEISKTITTSSGTKDTED